VAEIGLDGPGIDAVVGQLEAAGVAQHVRVDLHIEVCSLTSALDQPPLVNGVPRSDVNTNGDLVFCSRHCELFVVRSYQSQVRSGGHFHVLRLANCAFNEPSIRSLREGF
jgi:hypothetical protein